jgi:hypothetical protein
MSSGGDDALVVEFRRRRRAMRFGLLYVMLGLFLGAPACSGVVSGVTKGALGQTTTAALIPALQLVFLAAWFVYFLRTWRCPACGASSARATGRGSS